MGSQFVDFNADGHLDLVTATYDGSPWVSLGSTKGFAEPKLILDANGKRIMFSQHWDYDANDGNGEWINTGEPHCISAVAFDWDNDGDLDLLLGNHEPGLLFRQMNEGQNGKHSFTGVNIPVEIGDKPFTIEEGMTAPDLVDWDGDGLMDLVCGSFGEDGTGGLGGGVYLYRNIGAIGAPRFAPAETLIERSKKGANSQTQPDYGLYVDAVDYNGDGALDLVVGGYSLWTPVTRPLTDAEKAHIEELDEQTRETSKAMTDLRNKALQGIEAGSEEWTARYAKLRESSEYQELSKTASSARAELRQLRPGNKRVPAVWLYERKK